MMPSAFNLASGLSSINRGGISMKFGGAQLSRINMHVLNGNQGLVTAAMAIGAKRTVERVKREIQNQDLINTGTMLNSVRLMRTQTDLNRGVSITVGVDPKTAPYARFVNNGVGGRIYPTDSPMLRITPTRKMGGGGVFFATSVRGQQPSYFMERALGSMGITDFTRRYG